MEDFDNKLPSLFIGEPLTLLILIGDPVLGFAGLDPWNGYAFVAPIN